MSSCDAPPADKDTVMTRRPKFDKTKTCVKCKEKQGNIVIRHAVYCRACFDPLLTIRFKKSLDPHINAIPDGPRRKALKAAGGVLIGFSGGLSSSVLLDMVAKEYLGYRAGADNGDGTDMRGGTAHPRNKPIWKHANVCYVEVCGAYPGTPNRINSARSLAAQYGLNFISLQLEDAFDPSWWSKISGQPTSGFTGVDLSNEDLSLAITSTSPPTPLQLLQAHLSNLPTHTAVQATIATLTRVLLLYTARAEGCSHLLLGTSLTTLSINLIAGMAMGSGFGVGKEVGEEWRPEGNVGGNVQKESTVRVVRPLRDIGTKECAVWAWWHGLKIIGRERGKQGIGKLTRDFVTGLESDYPATVSTIARTCAKLAPKGEEEGICKMCQRPVQQGVQEWKARISIRSYDNFISPPHLLNPPVAKAPSQTPSLTPHLCYACHTMFTSKNSRGLTLSSHSDPLLNSTDLVPLPMWTGDGNFGSGNIGVGKNEAWTQTQMSSQAMRDVIGEFLIDHDS